jgi:hypothetical protein
MVRGENERFMAGHCTGGVPEIRHRSVPLEAHCRTVVKHSSAGN